MIHVYRPDIVIIPKLEAMIESASLRTLRRCDGRPAAFGLDALSTLTLLARTLRSKRLLRFTFKCMHIAKTQSWPGGDWLNLLAKHCPQESDCSSD